MRFISSADAPSSYLVTSACVADVRKKRDFHTRPRMNALFSPRPKDRRRALAFYDLSVYAGIILLVGRSPRRACRCTLMARVARMCVCYRIAIRISVRTPALPLLTQLRDVIVSAALKIAPSKYTRGPFTTEAVRINENTLGTLANPRNDARPFRLLLLPPSAARRVTRFEIIEISPHVS